MTTTSGLPYASNMIYRDDRLEAALSSNPISSGHTVISLNSAPHEVLFELDPAAFQLILKTVRRLAAVISAHQAVSRCALVTDGSSFLQIIPLHGLDAEWKPILCTDKEFNDTYPGYVHSKDGPTMEGADLDAIRDRIRTASGLRDPVNITFDGNPENNNLFAKIVRGQLQQWRVWEDDQHIAFLTPFANTPGFTVVVPRLHLGSDIFGLADEEYEGMVSAAYKVAKVLQKGMGVKKVGMFFEGFEINYAHVKLVPIIKRSRGLETDIGTADFQKVYAGYLTSKPGPSVEPSALEDAAKELRQMCGQ